MANTVNIFISASSSDLKTLRNQIKVWLLDMGWHPVVQDHFAPDDKTVIQMLRNRIKKCDAVLHIVGKHYGAEPQSPPDGGARKSYTQLEAALALKHRKRLFIVLLDEDFPYDQHEPETEDRQILQQAYRLQIATGERLYIVGRTPAQLEPEIRKLRVEVDKLSRSRRYVALLFAIPLILALSTAVYFLNLMIRDAREVMNGAAVLADLKNKASKGDASSDAALIELRNELRKYRPDIDDVPPAQLVNIVGEMIDNVKAPTTRSEGLSGPTKQALNDAQKDADKLEFSKGAERLDKQITQFKAEESGRALEYAALLGDRGRFSRLQLRYREAAGYYHQAADQAGGDAQAAEGYLIAAADSLYAQGDEFGDNQALLDAIEAYRSALVAAPRERDPAEWARIQNKLANALEKLGERESGTTHLEQAVDTYSQVLEVRGREKDPSGWAVTKNDMAYALIKLGERESGTARYEAARTACTDALGVLTQTRDAHLWAAVQNNLGNALLMLGQDESTTFRLEGAVQAYKEALKVRSPQNEPFEWARTESNLAIALETLGRHETGTARLEQAVATYKEVQNVFTPERLPLEWAKLEDNLGLALVAIGERESGTAHLEEAVKAFGAALQVRTRERMPFEWATTQNNLGYALEKLGKREAGTARLEASVTALNQALSENTREKVPMDWAMTEDNLGKALTVLGERGADTARLKAAVAAFKEVLVEYSKETSAADAAQSAEAQNDLGNALRALGEHESGTENLEAAVAAFSEALRVRTRDQMPLDWAESIGDQGVAQMLLAKRTRNADMAKAAFEKIEVAYTTKQGGGDNVRAADYGTRLSEARAVIDQLTKR